MLVILFCLALTTGCANQGSTRRVPSDFVFVMDVRSAADDLPGNIHVHVQVDAKGKGQFEYYDTGDSIRYDLDDMITYEASQVVKSGKFNLSEAELGQLWDVLNQNHFFELEEHYQMALGHSFAFIVVEANDKRHLVDNIGMEVPEIRTIVETTRTILPQQIKFSYGEGFKP